MRSSRPTPRPRSRPEGQGAKLSNLRAAEVAVKAHPANRAAVDHFANVLPIVRASRWAGSLLNWGQPVTVDAPSISTIRPIRRLIRRVARSTLEPGAIEIHHIAAQTGVIGKHLPRKGMVFLADSKKATKRHHWVRDLAGILVDYQMMDRAQALASAVLNGGTFDLFGGN